MMGKEAGPVMYVCMYVESAWAELTADMLCHWTLKELPVRSLYWSGCDRASPGRELSYRPGTASVLQSHPQLQKMGLNLGTLTLIIHLWTAGNKYNLRSKDDVRLGYVFNVCYHSIDILCCCLELESNVHMVQINVLNQAFTGSRVVVKDQVWRREENTVIHSNQPVAG